MKRQHTSTETHCVIFTLLGRYVALIGSYWLLMGPTSHPATSVACYQATLRNIPEDQRSHLHGGLSLKSYTVLRL